MNPLEIKTSYGWRVGCLGALAAVFVLPFLASAIFAIANDEAERAGIPLLVALIAAVAFTLPIFVILFSKRGSAKRFDERGVTCHSGGFYPWSDLQGVREVYMRNRAGSFINHYEMTFRMGKVPIYFRVAKNEADVMRAISALQGGVIPWLQGAPQR